MTLELQVGKEIIVISVTKYEFEEILRNGPESIEIVAFRAVSDKYIKFELKEEYDKALVVLEPIDSPTKIYGFADGIEDIEITLDGNSCQKWVAFAKQTRQELGPYMCN